MSDLNRAIELIKNGQKTTARHILISLLKQDRHNEQAWLYLAACATTKSEFSQSIQEVLTLNPNNADALKQAEKFNIPLPPEVLEAQAAAKQSKKKRRRETAPRTGGSRLRRVILLLLIIAAGGAALVYMQQQDEEADTEAVVQTQEATAEATDVQVTVELTEEATAESTEVAAINETEEAETEEAPSSPTPRPTNTPRPTSTPTQEIAAAVTEEIVETPTLVPTATPTRTLAPTQTPTPAATNTPEPTPTPAANAMLSLVYDEDSVYIINLTDENLDISSLRFVQENPAAPDDPRDFEAIEWQQDAYRGPGSVYQIQPDSCFSIGIDIPSASAKPVDCVRLTQWQARRDISQFWTKFEGGPDEFLVYQGETIIATCFLDAFSCDISLPSP